MRALLCLSALVLATGCEGAGFTSLSPPNLVVNVDALDFGEIPIGFTVSKKVTLLNSGEVVLDVRAIRVEVGGPFAVMNPVTTIAAGKDAEITITFSPTVARGYQGTLVIESDASNTTSKSVPLSGAGMAVNTCGDCNMPPVAACLTPSDRVSYASTGSCMMGMCQYTASVEVCTNGCERAMCKGVVAADAGPLNSSRLNGTQLNGAQSKLTPQAAAVFRSMGVERPGLRDADADQATSTADVRSAARTLAKTSIVDILVFFAVLMVGFAYVWSRGDLDWVRAASTERSQAPPPRAVGIDEGSETALAS